MLRPRHHEFHGKGDAKKPREIRKAVAAAACIGMLYGFAGCGARSSVLSPHDGEVSRTDAGIAIDVRRPDGYVPDRAPLPDAGMDVRADVLKPDTSQPDSVQPDMQQPDTMQPDSTPPDMGPCTTKYAPQFNAPALKYQGGFFLSIGDYLDKVRDNRKGPEEYKPGALGATAAHPSRDGTVMGLIPSYIPKDVTLFPSPVPPYTLTFPYFLSNKRKVTDSAAGKTYTQNDVIGLSLETRYLTGKGVVSDIKGMFYQAAFEGFGIPVCTTPKSSPGAPHQYAHCADDYRTAHHHVPIKFMGFGNYVILDMIPPAKALDSEVWIVEGGLLRLGRERDFVKHLANNCPYVVDGYKYHYQGYQVTGSTGVPQAIIYVVPPTGPVKKDKIQVGGTKTFCLDSNCTTAHHLRVWNVAGAAKPQDSPWAQVSLLSDVVHLVSGQYLWTEYGKTKTPVKVQLACSNKGGSATDAQPDHLKWLQLSVTGSDVAKVSSSKSSLLTKGDSAGVSASVDSFRLTSKGLNISNNDRSALKFQLERNSAFNLKITGGNCTIEPAYIVVTTSLPNSFEAYSGSMKALGDKVFIAASGGKCNGVAFPSGSLFMKKSPTSSDYVRKDYKYSNSFNHHTGKGINGIHYEKAADALASSGMAVKRGLVPLNAQLSSTPDYFFEIMEGTGGKMTYLLWGAKISGASSTFEVDVTDLKSKNPVFTKGAVTYKYAGPVTTTPGFGFYSKDMITETGAKVYGKSDVIVTFGIAKKSAHVMYGWAATQ